MLSSTQSGNPIHDSSGPLRQGRPVAEPMVMARLSAACPSREANGPERRGVRGWLEAVSGDGREARSECLDGGVDISIRVSKGGETGFKR